MRELEFLSPAHVSLITERRRHAPWGAAGGGPGRPGRNLLNGCELPEKVALEVAAGDRLRIETPGGGGWGDGDQGQEGLRGMCGICGELRLDGAPADPGAIVTMMDRLRRRGPDHGGSYSDGPLGMGHRRLAIIDLSPRSNQPLLDPALGLALVFNGTIYNYRALRQGA